MRKNLLVTVFFGLAARALTAKATPRPPTPASSPNDPVLDGTGDIASCGSGGDEKTAPLLDAIPGTVFTPGDNDYPNGTPKQFPECYDPTSGRHKARTRPV